MSYDTYLSNRKVSLFDNDIRHHDTVLGTIRPRQLSGLFLLKAQVLGRSTTRISRS